MNSKTYKLPNGKKAVFEYDHDGIGKVTIEAMDMLMGLITDGRKCGEWIDREQCQVDEDGYDVAICSNCKEEITIDPRHDNYCPNCGADMRGDKE